MVFDTDKLTVSEKKRLLEEKYKDYMHTELESRRFDAESEMRRRGDRRRALKQAIMNSVMIFAGAFLVLRVILFTIDKMGEEPQATLIELDRSACVEYDFPGKWMNAYECHWTSPLLGDCYYVGVGSEGYRVYCEGKENAQPHRGGH